MLNSLLDQGVSPRRVTKACHQGTSDRVPPCHDQREATCLGGALAKLHGLMNPHQAMGIEASISRLGLW